MAKSNTPALVETTNSLKPYQKVSELTGEVINKYKYLEGHPRQYRFDAKEGVFNINGSEKLGRTFTFQPIAWRIFKDNILNMGVKNWAELFFIDEKDCVSSILFHGYSVDNIFRLIEPLYYDDLTLADVVITAIAEKKENTKIQPKGVYYIATFSYKMAETQRSSELKQFSREVRIFRQETLTDIASLKTAYNFYNPFANGEVVDELPAGVTPQGLRDAVEEHYTQAEAV
ncbi:hypothetical protein BN8_p06758 (plasmid) [Fibrisoma limi BUZ 3]|uniref:Uncharacterized protein n=1 Tax=Fibrisoma limi BUZ 3 TaxID=1185876 RepID=I2GTX2_9BACT|nr:hypothetical protein [Fibrisoma limi]CCH57573.1 hypothetical protein BN8_p06758 [Fibrisoma limi BUZ 3]